MLKSELIAAAVGPVVIMSSCGLLCSTFYTRITNVIMRLRVFQRERLAEQMALKRESDEEGKKHRREMLNILNSQTAMLIKRIRLIRVTLFCVLSTILALAVCSLVLGLSTIAPSLVNVAIAFFVLGLCLLIVGVVFAILDLQMALKPVVLETDFVTRRLQGDEGV